MSVITILFVADICGRPGRQAAAHLIRKLRVERSIDMVIANIENAAGGFGVTPEMSHKAFSYGIDVQTSGNHIWDRVQILEYIAREPRLLRPANYPPAAPGNGEYIFTVRDHKIAVINLMGRTYMSSNTDCPFRKAHSMLNALPEDCRIVFIDFHGEATSEKQAFAHYMDGRVTAVIGTHTHVQTADEKISVRGTAYLSDAGMTGPHDSILGMEKGPALGRFITGLPKRFTTATDDVRLQGCLLTVREEDGFALGIERVSVPFDISKVDSKENVEVDD